MDTTKTAEERVFVGKTRDGYFGVYVYISNLVAHRVLKTKDDTETNKVAASLRNAFEAHAAEARREAIKIALELLYDDDLQHLSWADACAEIAKAIEQLGESDHESCTEIT